MRAHLGWLTFLLAAAFATCLVATLILNTWFGFPGSKCVIGFFAFGIPTMITGGATATLWDGSKSLQTLLGWAGTMTAIVCGVAVLLLVGAWIFSETVQPEVGPLVWRLVGFGVCGIACGGFGIAVLFQAEGKSI
jgi:hypothetical protein